MKRFIDQGQAAFYRLARRDQMAVLALVFAIALYACGLLVYGLQKQRVVQQRQLAISSETLGEVQQLARKVLLLQRSRDGVSTLPPNLTQLIDTTLKANALQLSGFQPGRDGGMRLRLETAEFDRVLHWLHELETVHGIQIAELSLLPTGDTGRVSVQVQLAGEP